MPSAKNKVIATVKSTLVDLDVVEGGLATCQRQIENGKMPKELAAKITELQGLVSEMRSNTEQMLPHLEKAPVIAVTLSAPVINYYAGMARQIRQEFDQLDSVV